MELTTLNMNQDIQVPGKNAASGEHPVRVSEEKPNPEIAKLRDELMMDLEEVQSFLYLIIGAKIKVDHGRHVGGMVNTVA